MEERAKARFEAEQSDYQAKLSAREAKVKETGRKSRGKKPGPPQAGPGPRDQFNFTDPESRIMKDPGSFEQCYNAPAAVEVESLLVVGQRVSDAPNDKEQLAPTLEAVSPAAGSVSAALVDGGYYSEKAVVAVEQGGQGPTVYAAMKRHGHRRNVRQIEERPDPPAPPEGATMAEIMAQRLETKAGKKRYALRKQSVGPVFGIIKEAMGFRRFSMRGREKASLEWTLVTTAYNLKRLFNMGMKIARA